MKAMDLRPRSELKAVYRSEEGKGIIKYITGQLETGDLSEILTKIHDADVPEEQRQELSLMAISIHSCGNLSHFGIRSMILNPSIKAVAIVGCCYNLLTEKLGPPTYKVPFARPTLQAINGRVKRESEKHDPQGFPMSERVSTYDGKGIRFNITARMMACQAPLNWGPADSDSFFTRHFYRAVLQKIFLDKGVISKVYHGKHDSEEENTSPFNVSTNPVIIGSLGKSCYKTFPHIRARCHQEADHAQRLRQIHGRDRREDERHHGRGDRRVRHGIFRPQTRAERGLDAHGV